MKLHEYYVYFHQQEDYPQLLDESITYCGLQTILLYVVGFKYVHVAI
jgi:hypothetical protein